MDGGSFDSANLQPVGFWARINTAGKLKKARKAVADARTVRKGVFADVGGLILLPYELRFLARKGSTGPDRFVIDLGKPGSNTIVKPENYYTILKIEDRLFIPREFVPLFLVNGWAMA